MWPHTGIDLTQLNLLYNWPRKKPEITKYRNRHAAQHGNRLNSVKYATQMAAEMAGNDETL